MVRANVYKLHDIHTHTSSLVRCVCGIIAGTFGGFGRYVWVLGPYGDGQLVYEGHWGAGGHRHGPGKLLFDDGSV